MVYISNADVLYRRKKNTYRGSPTRGVGYGYSKSGIADLLKAFTGNGRRMKLFPKKKSVTQTRQKLKMALLDLKEATQFQNVILELSHYFYLKLYCK